MKWWTELWAEVNISDIIQTYFANFPSTIDYNN